MCKLYFTKHSMYRNRSSSNSTQIKTLGFKMHKVRLQFSQHKHLTSTFWKISRWPVELFIQRPQPTTSKLMLSSRQLANLHVYFSGLYEVSNLSIFICTNAAAGSIESEVNVICKNKANNTEIGCCATCLQSRQLEL